MDHPHAPPPGPPPAPTGLIDAVAQMARPAPTYPLPFPEPAPSWTGFGFIGLILLIGLASGLVVYASAVLLLFFAAVLVAIFLRTCATFVRQHTLLPDLVALIAVSCLLLSALATIGLALAPGIGKQVEQLSQDLPAAVKKLHDAAARYDNGRNLMGYVPSPEQLMGGDQSYLFSKLTGIFSTTLGFLIGLVVVGIVGFYLAADPDIYIDGALALVPPSSRPRVRFVAREIGSTLRWWLMGRMLASLLMGIFTTIGLSVVGIPQAMTFGVLAGLLEFVPTIGPVMSFIPPLLIALTGDSPSMAVGVVIVFLLIQLLESGLVVPLIEQRTVRLPPAFTLTAQILLGLLLGGLGLLLATPLMASLIVLIKRLYVEDVLGDELAVVEAAAPCPPINDPDSTAATSRPTASK